MIEDIYLIVAFIISTIVLGVMTIATLSAIMDWIAERAFEQDRTTQCE